MNLGFTACVNYNIGTLDFEKYNGALSFEIDLSGSGFNKSN